MRSLFLILLALSLSGSEKELLPVAHKTQKLLVGKSIPYADDETGISFPVHFGPFEKWMVRKNAHPLIGTVIRYADQDSGSADIFIYQLEAGSEQIISFVQTREEWQVLMRKIRDPKQKRFGVFLQKEEGMILSGGKNAGFYASFLFSARQGEFISELFLIPRENQMIKIRVTVSEGNASKSRDFASQALQLLFAGEKISLRKNLTPSGSSPDAEK